MARGEFSHATRERIQERFGGRCAWCGAVPWIGSIQHRRARGMGGSRDPLTSSPENGVLVCGTGTLGCHGEIEAHPRRAAARGFRVRSIDRPGAVPIQTVWGWYVLDAEGGATPTDPVPQMLAELEELDRLLREAERATGSGTSQRVLILEDEIRQLEQRLGSEMRAGYRGPARYGERAEVRFPIRETIHRLDAGGE